MCPALGTSPLRPWSMRQQGEAPSTLPAASLPVSLLQGSACLGHFEMLSVAALARVMFSTQKLVPKGRIPEMEMGDERVHLLHMRKMRAAAGGTSSQTRFKCWKEG